MASDPLDDTPGGAPSDALDDALAELIERSIEDPLFAVDEFLGQHADLAQSLRREFEGLIASGVIRRPEFDRYEIGERIGEGGMGLVRRGLDRELGRPVAIKTIRPDLLKDSGVAGEMALRFRREVRVCAALQHPNVLPVFGMIGNVDGVPMLALPLLQGRDLGQHIRSRRSIPFDVEDLEIFERVCDAIEHAHSRGIVHRDLKPSNVFLARADDSADARGSVFVIDWGVARRESELESDGDARTDGGAGLTAIGDTIGSPTHMAPEQARGESAGRPADVFALGAILHHMLTGSPPYYGERDVLLAKAANAQVMAPRLPVRPRAPRELLAIAVKAMAADPSHRYRDVRALEHDLRAYTEHRSGVAWRDPAPARLVKAVRRHPVVAVVALAAAVLFAVGGLAWSTMVEKRLLERSRRVHEFALAADRQLRSFRLEQMPEGQAHLDLGRSLDALALASYPIWTEEGEARLAEDLVDPVVAPADREATIRALERVATLLWTCDYTDLALHQGGVVTLDPAALKQFVRTCSDGRGVPAWSAVQRLVERLREPPHRVGWQAFLALVKNEPEAVDQVAAVVRKACRDGAPPGALAFLARVVGGIQLVGDRPDQRVRARDLWREIASREPSTFIAHLRAADGFLRDGPDATLAIAHGESAKALRPGSPWPYFALSNAYAMRGKIPEAWQALAALRRLAPPAARAVVESATAWVYRATAQAQQSQPDLARSNWQEAEDAARAAVRMRPSGIDAHLLASILAEQGKDDEARAAYERGMALAPDFHPLRFGYVQLLQRIGDYPGIISVHLAHARKHPDYAPSWSEAALAAEVSGYHEHAVPLLERALAARTRKPEQHIPASGSDQDIELLRFEYALLTGVEEPPTPGHRLFVALNASKRGEFLRAHRLFGEVIQSMEQVLKVNGRRASYEEFGAPTWFIFREAARVAQHVAQGDGVLFASGTAVRWHEDWPHIARFGARQLETISAADRPRLREDPEWTPTLVDAAERSARESLARMTLRLAASIRADVITLEEAAPFVTETLSDADFSALLEERHPAAAQRTLRSALERLLPGGAAPGSTTGASGQPVEASGPRRKK